MKKQNLDTDTQREDDVRRHREKPHEDKAEIRVMLPQAKEHQKMASTPREARGVVPAEPSEGTQTCRCPDWGLLALELWDYRSLSLTLPCFSPKTLIRSPVPSSDSRSSSREVPTVMNSCVVCFHHWVHLSPLLSFVHSLAVRRYAHLDSELWAPLHRMDPGGGLWGSNPQLRAATPLPLSRDHSHHQHRRAEGLHTAVSHSQLSRMCTALISRSSERPFLDHHPQKPPGATHAYVLSPHSPYFAPCFLLPPPDIMLLLVY